MENLEGGIAKERWGPAYSPEKQGKGQEGKEEKGNSK